VAQADRFQLLKVFSPRVRCYLSGRQVLSPTPTHPHLQISSAAPFPGLHAEVS
jgi:hypothetical protein